MYLFVKTQPLKITPFRPSRRRTGVVLIGTILLTIPVLFAMALMVDLGLSWRAQTMLDSVARASALAAIERYSSDPQAEAQNMADAQIKNNLMPLHLLSVSTDTQTENMVTVNLTATTPAIVMPLIYGVLQAFSLAPPQNITDYTISSRAAAAQISKTYEGKTTYTYELK